MKKLYYLTMIGLLFIGLNAYSQMISGYVYDELENKPLEGAFVYLDGTTINATTDSEGYFEIRSRAAFNVPLVVTYVGFENFVLEDPFSYKKRIKLMLREDSIKLEEVVINKNLPFTRKQMLRVFRDHFLGTSAAGRSCRILNEDDIKLTYDLTTNTLKASCAVPIQIKNKRLEYDINFSLVQFEVQYNRLTLLDSYVNRNFFAGTTAYIDTSTAGSANKKRKEAYLGSVAHFMKTLATNDWKNQKFQLYSDRLPADPSSHFTLSDTLDFKKVTVRDTGNRQSFEMTRVEGGTKQTIKYKKPKKFDVIYDGKNQSSFEIANERIFIDANGLFLPIQDILFSGYLSTLRAGDLLPTDYIYIPD